MAKMKTVGSRAEVFHGNAKRTSGRLTKDDLMKNAAGRIVSRKKHEAGKNALKFLHAKGYIAVKGKFGSKRASDAVTAAEPAAETAPTATDAVKASEVVVPPATS
jgi:L-asparaginase II